MISIPRSAPRGSTRLALVVIGGLVLRLVVLLLAPRYGYLPDHDDLVRWALQAAREGLPAVYEHPPPPADLRMWQGDGWAVVQRPLARLCNYPPLSLYLLAASGRLLVASGFASPINTAATRLAVSLWSLPFDLAVAWGAAALAMSLGWRAAAAPTFGLVWLAPPLWLVSCLWGQVDTWVLAPAVWMVVALLGGRPLAAGILFGLCAALKPQAAAFLPLWLMALLLGRRRRATLLGLLAAAATLLAIASPVQLRAGGAWWQHAVVENLFAHSKGFTTLMAFNPWYGLGLLTGSFDESRTWAGIALDGWAALALAAALAAGALALFRRGAARHDPRALLAWTVWSLLAMLTFATRMHERFAILLLPFLAVAAAGWRRLRPGLALFLLTASLQIAWPLWIATTPIDWEVYLSGARAEHAAALAALPAAERGRAPSFEQSLDDSRREYRRARAPTLALEGALCLASLLAFLAVAVPLLKGADRPPSTDGPARGEGRRARDAH